MKAARLAVVVAIILGSAAWLHAQTAPDLENGFKNFGSYDGSHLDTVNLMNGNLMLHAPLLPGCPQRGSLAVQPVLTFNSKTWQVICASMPGDGIACGWFHGGTSITLQQPTDLQIQRASEVFFSGTSTSFTAQGYSLTGADGATHQLMPTVTTNGIYMELESLDTSGYHVAMSGSDGSGVPNTATISDRHGNQYIVVFNPPNTCGQPPSNPTPAGTRVGPLGGYAEPMMDDTPRGSQFCPQWAAVQQVTDSNGNFFSAPNPSQPTDTLGRVLPLSSITTASDNGGCATTYPVAGAYLLSYSAPDGTTHQIKMCYTQLTMQTAFNQPGIQEYPGGPALPPGSNVFQADNQLPTLTTVILADGTKWAFAYDNFGEISSVSLPTGGSIAYTWTTVSTCSAGQTPVSRSVATRTLNDGQGHSSTWTYNWGAVVNKTITNTVTDPLGDDTVHVFTALDQLCGFYETRTKTYRGLQSAGQLLKQVDTSYYPVLIYTTDSGENVAGNVVPKDITTTVYPSGKVSKIHREYDTGLGTGKPIFGDVKKELEYDWGQGTPGPLLRETDTTYQWEINSAYLTAHHLDLPASVIVKDGGGNRVAETDYSYDEAAYLTTPSPAISTQHSAPPYSVRGNQTTVSRWLNTTNSFISSHTNWYDTGEVYKSIDPLGHTTTHSYDPFYVGAYATQTCSPATNNITHCVSGTYDFNTGILTSLTNENATTQASGNTPGDSAHTSNYTYDSMFRITSAQAPPDPANDGLRATTSFNFSAPNAAPLYVQRTKSVTTALSDSATSFFDGLGRGYKGQHVFPNGTATVDTTFDLAGHAATVSNPYFTTSDPTYGTTTNAYDALDRVTQTTKQDGSISRVAYDVVTAATVSVDCTQTTDEAGKTRRVCSDALGRLGEVDEPNAASVGTSATGSVTINGTLQDAIINGGTPHSAASGSPLSSIVLPDGSSHTFYFDSSQHICQVYWNSVSGWVNEDLTAITGNTLVGAGSGLTSVGLANGAVNVFYVGPNQHIYDMYWSASGGWNNQDLTAITGNTPAASGSALTSTTLSDGSPSGTVHAFYFGPNQHVYHLYFSTAAGWANQDLTAITGNTLAASGSDIAGVLLNNNSLNIFYLDVNQDINDIYWSSTANWGNADITATTGHYSAAAGSKLSGLAPATGSILSQVFYEGANQHIYNTYYSSSLPGWQTQDLTAATGNTLAAPNSTLTSTIASGNWYVGYVGAANQHDYALYCCGPGWGNADLNAAAGSTIAVGTGSALSSVGSADNFFVHEFYLTGSQHVYDLYYNAGLPGWQGADMTASSHNTQPDSGVVSLTVGAFTASACYENSTPPACAGKPVNYSASDVAAALAGALNVAGSPASASASGSIINMTWLQPGPFTPTIGALTTTHDNATMFPNPSYTSPASSFANGQAAPIDSTAYVTMYQYDALGNLLRVDQKGSAPSDSTQWRTRTFTYDSLSRLLTATNPESGTITYTYDADGELLQKTSPAPNPNPQQPTQTVSYCYDELHRLPGKGYGAQNCPPAAPVVSYAYDSGVNAKGHLTSLTDQAGTASYTYDILGRLATETRSLIGANNASISKSLSYEYNLDGSLYKLHYPSGAVVTYTPDSAGRTVSAVDSGSGINYVTGATYGPDSALTGFVSGSSGAAAITNSFTYNKRLQPLTMSATAPSQTVYSIGYDFHAGNGTANSGTDNGNVYGITNYKDQNRNQTFTYDALNRLTSAQNAGTNCATMVLQNKTEYWGNSYGYDAWGNLLQKNVTKCGAEGLTVTADAHNWIHASGTDYQYDAAGNMTYDATASLSYTFDQENRLTGAAGYTYTYDGDGNRVRKSNGNLAANGTLYWYMTPGVVAETDLAGTLKSEYVFFDGERVARRDGATGTGGVFYYFSDHLKTASVITDSAGVIKAESDYYPWGSELQFVNNDSNDYKFTGKKRDSETGLDNFGARYYSNAFWPIHDARLGSQSNRCPYAEFADPQSLNVYTYVRNIPTTKVDADGQI